MISQQVARYFKARRIGEGKWKAKCPLHQGHSDGSLSIAAADDGKTLVKCWGGRICFIRSELESFIAALPGCTLEEAQNNEEEKRG